MCGLWNERNAIVGSLGVELRKRTTIGVELAAKVRSLADIIRSQSLRTLPLIAQDPAFPR